MFLLCQSREKERRNELCVIIYRENASTLLNGLLNGPHQTPRILNEKYYHRSREEDKKNIHCFHGRYNLEYNNILCEITADQFKKKKRTNIVY